MATAALPSYAVGERHHPVRNARWWLQQVELLLWRSILAEPSPDLEYWKDEKIPQHSSFAVLDKYR